MLVLLALLATSFGSPEAIIQHIVMEGPSVEELEGVVKDPAGYPIPGVKIQLFDHPEVWLDKKFATLHDKRSKQKKLEETVTDEHGRFRLDFRRSGKHEIYCTFSGFDPLSYLVKVVPKKKVEAKELEINMHMSG